MVIVLSEFGMYREHSAHFIQKLFKKNFWNINIRFIVVKAHEAFGILVGWQ